MFYVTAVRLQPQCVRISKQWLVLPSLARQATNFSQYVWQLALL